MKRLIIALACAAPFLAGCVSVTELDPAAQSVKTISAEQAKSCTFVDSITANNMNTLSKDAEADARIRAFNRAAAVGGDSVVMTGSDLQVSSSGIGGTYFFSGDVYSCGK